MMLSSGESRIELRTVAQHRPEDVDPSAGPGDQRLVVPLALRPLAVVECPGLRRATEAREGRLVEDLLEPPVAAAHPAVVARAFSGIAGRRSQAGEGGELVGAGEAVPRIAHRRQELRAQERPHARQAGEYTRQRVGAEACLDLCIEGGDPLLEGEHLPGKFGDDGSGYPLGGRHYPLGFGGRNRRPGQAGGVPGTPALEVRLNAPAPGTEHRARCLVAAQQLEGAPVAHVRQGTLQARKRREEGIPYPLERPALVGHQVAAAREEEPQLGEQLVGGLERLEIASHTRLLGDDECVTAVGLGLASEAVTGPVHREARDVQDPLVASPKECQQQRCTASGLVDRPARLATRNGEDLFDERREVGLLVLDPAREQDLTLGIDDHRPMEFLAHVHADPRLRPHHRLCRVHRHLRFSVAYGSHPWTPRRPFPTKRSARRRFLLAIEASEGTGRTIPIEPSSGRNTLTIPDPLGDPQAILWACYRVGKYALSLQLSDPGFDFSVLSEFRSRLVEGGTEHLLLESLLEVCKERGYLKVRGRQRTDSTHVLGALRVLSQLEQTAETMRAALNALAAADPDWLTEHADPEWFARYGRRIEDQRLPKGKEARKEYLKTVGADGAQLLAHLDAPHTPRTLKTLEEVEILRQLWEQHYERSDGQTRVLDPKERPEAAYCIESPYEVEARYSTKRSMSWV